MDIERFLSRALEVIGLGKNELAASYFATCDECDCDTLAQKAEPGDHIAVIDMTPDSGIARRLLWQFLKSADGAAIIRYDRALSRENTLSLASVMIMEYTNTTDPPRAYDIAKRNCDIFASSCRLGRLRINLDDGVDPVDVGAAVEMLDQAVYAKVSPLVVKLLGFSQDGSLVGQFSGFMHGEVIVAAGHMQGFCGKPLGSTSPAVAFKARYPTDGFEEDLEVVAPSPPGNVPDLILLKGSRSATSLWSTDLEIMASVYALGYTGTENKPSCSKGSLSSTMPGSVAITAHADDRFSGGPVVDKHGRLLGVVKGALGTTIMRIGITPNYDLHTYLLQARYPGLI
eukprot:gene32345-biopygen13825